MTIKNPVGVNDIDSGEIQPAPASRFYNVRLSPRDAWFGVTMAALFNAVGMSIEIGVIRRIPGISATSSVISALVGAALLVVLFVRRKRPSVAWANVIYLINTASVVAALLFTNVQFTIVDHQAPFQ